MNTTTLPFHYDQSTSLSAPADAVFRELDDFTQFGAHMMQSSWMMAGSRMRYEFDETGGRAPGASVRLLGSFLGARLEIEERVIERNPPVSKSWQTVGQPQMLILESYRMGFTIAPQTRGCSLRVFIDYATPTKGLGRWLGRLAGGVYARWCVRSTIRGMDHRFRFSSHVPNAKP
jgi:hypothetical protein